MPKKYKLTGDFEAEYTIIGMTSQARGYKLAMLINEKLGLHFHRTDDFTRNGKYDLDFALFEYQAKDTRRIYYLLFNRSTEGMLAPALKGIDAFLIFFEILNPVEIRQLISALRNGPGVQAAYEIKPETVKDFDQVLEDLEVHLMNRPAPAPE